MTSVNAASARFASVGRTYRCLQILWILGVSVSQSCHIIASYVVELWVRYTSVVNMRLNVLR